MHRKEQIAVGGVVLVVVRIFSLLYKRRKAHKKTQAEADSARRELQATKEALAQTTAQLELQKRLKEKSVAEASQTSSVLKESKRQLADTQEELQNTKTKLEEVNGELFLTKSQSEQYRRELDTKNRQLSATIAQLSRTQIQARAARSNGAWLDNEDQYEEQENSW